MTISRRQFLTFAAAGLVTACAPAVPDLGLGRACAPGASPEAGDIPPQVLAEYQRVGAETGIPWTLLAGIGHIESGHDPDPKLVGPELDGAPGVMAIPATSYGTSLHGNDRWEQAVGMMQFLPSTARPYVESGLVDDPRDFRDSVTLAGAYLLEVGVLANERSALLRYNNSQQYVDDVLAAAERYADGGAQAVDCSQQLIDTAGVTGSASAVLGLAEAGRITLDDRNISDVRNPALDSRVLAIMEAIAARHAFAVSVIKTGHYKCIGGGNGGASGTCGPRGVSNHWEWRAVDIWQLDGVGVSRTNRDARAIVQWLDGMSGPLRPDEVGGPFADLTGSPGWFHDSNHLRHLHIGWNVVPRAVA